MFTPELSGLAATEKIRRTRNPMMAVDTVVEGRRSWDKGGAAGGGSSNTPAPMIQRGNAARSVSRSGRVAAGERLLWFVAGPGRERSRPGLLHARKTPGPPSHNSCYVHSRRVVPVARVVRSPIKHHFRIKRMIREGPISPGSGRRRRPGRAPRPGADDSAKVPSFPASWPPHWPLRCPA